MWMDCILLGEVTASVRRSHGRWKEKTLVFDEGSGHASVENDTSRDYSYVYKNREQGLNEGMDY
jgi:hypothetical protein